MHSVGAMLLAVFTIAGCSTKTSDDTGDVPPGGETLDGSAVYVDNCSGCHGANGEGAGPNPSLIDGVPNLSDEELMNVLTNPPGTMAIISLSTEEADAVFVYLRDVFGEYGGAR